MDNMVVLLVEDDPSDIDLTLHAWFMLAGAERTPTGRLRPQNLYVGKS
ncbi:MAG TPA: hypothetical protein HPP81_07675 [Deltaproteobacteria bacterium]|jgi:hypothetical protein|nr:hypothetical protein [Deltaproteobacteria bacterium]